MDIFLSRVIEIRGTKAPEDVQGLVWFTDGAGSEEGTQAGICVPSTRLFFSLGKER